MEATAELSSKQSPSRSNLAMLVLGVDAFVIFLAAVVWYTANYSSPANSHMLVFPENYRGQVVIRTNVPGGVVLKPEGREYTLQFNVRGECNIQGLLPQADWQNVYARYQSGRMLDVVWPGKRIDGDIIALRDMGSSPDATEYLFVIGTESDAQRALREAKEKPPLSADPVQ